MSTTWKKPQSWEIDPSGHGNKKVEIVIDWFKNKQERECIHCINPEKSAKALGLILEALEIMKSREWT